MGQSVSFKVMYGLGIMGLVFAVYDFAGIQKLEASGLAFDRGFHLADEALAFASVVALVGAGALRRIERRLKLLEEKRT